MPLTPRVFISECGGRGEAINDENDGQGRIDDEERVELDRVMNTDDTETRELETNPVDEPVRAADHTGVEQVKANKLAKGRQKINANKKFKSHVLRSVSNCFRGLLMKVCCGGRVD